MKCIETNKLVKGRKEKLQGLNDAKLSVQIFAKREITTTSKHT